MKVYNLTQQQLEFHGFSIPPNGGWREVPALDVFVSDRDLEMARRGVISFTSLPPGWRPVGMVPPAKPVTPEPPAKPAQTFQVPTIAPKSDEKKSDEKKGKQDKWQKTE